MIETKLVDRSQRLLAPASRGIACDLEKLVGSLPHR